MESSAHRRLTPAEGRRFAFTLALGFGALGALLLWRGRVTPSTALFGLAGAAAIAGLLLPARLAPVMRGWSALGVALSRVTSPLFFGLIYMVVLTPIALLRRGFSRSPLARNPDASSYWVRRPVADTDLQRTALERQF